MRFSTTDANRGYTKDNVYIDHPRKGGDTDLGRTRCRSRTIASVFPEIPIIIIVVVISLGGILLFAFKKKDKISRECKISGLFEKAPLESSWMEKRKRENIPVLEHSLEKPSEPR